ncbi:MAG: hypothetical protein DI563_01765 [Variovorax paradoxus]|uniref:Uncharacterized protein n=1 Tax=Variovorax paradoxus TaxID=34073 RepID=A0A2W5STG1_VARPD|nr:MAG: hypothetical protein DI563_01765 [Variovorax paradoxus]
MNEAICIAAVAFFFLMCTLIYILIAFLTGATTLALFEDSGRIEEEHAIVIGGLWPVTVPLIFFGAAVYIVHLGVKLFAQAIYYTIKGR